MFFILGKLLPKRNGISFVGIECCIALVVSSVVKYKNEMSVKPDNKMSLTLEISFSLLNIVSTWCLNSSFVNKLLNCFLLTSLFGIPFGEASVKIIGDDFAL